MGVNYYPVAPGWISNVIYKNVNRPLGCGEGGVHLCIMLVQSKNTWEIETWFPNQNCELHLTSWLTGGVVLAVS